MDSSLPNQTVNDNQNVQQTSVQQQPSTGGQIPNQDDVQAQQQVQSQQQQPIEPVGSVAKELGPIGSSVEAKPEVYIQPSGAETQPEVSVELKEHGVETVVDAEKPQLTEHHNNIGLRPAKESVPAPTQVTSSSHIQLPMTEEEALKTIKTTSAKDSKHWLAVLADKVYKQIRFIHGKITS